MYKYLLAITLLTSAISTFSQPLNTNLLYGKWAVLKKISAKIQVWSFTKVSLFIVSPKNKEVKCTYATMNLSGEDFLLTFPVDSPYVFKYKIYHLDKNELKIKQVSYRTIDKNRNLSPDKTDSKPDNENLDFIRQKS
jgi:hypothetical protein